MAERTLNVTNLTNNQVGVAGKVVAAGATALIPLREIQGSRSRAADMAAQKAAGNIIVSFEGDVLSEDEIENLNAPKDVALGLIKETYIDLATADVDAIIVAITMSPAGLKLDDTALDGVIGAGRMNPPRNITITTTTDVGEAIEGGDAVIIGEDVEGLVRTETLAIAVLGASTTQVDVGAVAFRKIIRIQLPTDSSSAPGDAEVGFGDIVGLKSPLTAGGLIGEFENNAPVATAGTVVLSGVSAPNGTYLPNSTPNGALDFTIVYAA